MAFALESSPVPISIGWVRVSFRDNNTGEFYIQVIFDDGSTKLRSGNLLPHLTQQEKNQLQAFMVSLRERAEQQMLPV